MNERNLRFGSACRRPSSGFTLIELLTVIAIIAVLAALLFPVMSTAREQARATDCMTHLHQLWVAASVYRQDEGTFPPSLFGYVEACDPVKRTSLGIYLNNPASQTPCTADRIVLGFLYGEEIKDVNILHCQDSKTPSKAAITIAHFPPKPPGWPIYPSGTMPAVLVGQTYPYVTDNNAALAKSPPPAPASVCPSDSFGLVDCWLTKTPNHNIGDPKYYYVWDSYDIGPRVNPDGSVPVDGQGNPVFDLHYSRDWTGISHYYPDSATGAPDLPDQLKYSSPPSDKTLFAYCSWHTVTAHVPGFTAISMGGQTRKIDYKEVLKYGANYYNR